VGLHHRRTAAQVDLPAAELWGITEKELKEIRWSLQELG
jgi:hypothetical protein